METNLAANEKKMFADPATVIAVAEAVIEVYSLLKGGDEDSIDQALQQIQARFDVIIEELSLVIDLLRNLEVLIKEEIKNLLITGLKAEISAFFLNYQSFKNSPTDPQSINELVTRYVRLQSLSIQASQYGYTHYDTMGFAFSVEYSLACLLKKEKAILNSITMSYRDNYFRKAVDPSIQGSIQAVKVNKQGKIDELSGKFVANTFDCGMWDRPDNPGSRRGRLHHYHRTLIVKGSLNEGFSFEISDVEVFTPSTPHEPRYLFGALEYSNALQNEYNQASITFKQLTEQTIYLENAGICCLKYIDEMNKLID
jgi:hypothetical protein